MTKTWVLIIAIGLCLTLGVVFYNVIRDFVRKTYGKKWLTVWTNKLYFWQSLIFMSTSGTILIMYILKWGNVLTF